MNPAKDASTPIGTIELRNPLGMLVRISITSLKQAYAIMRKYGSQGWISGDVPAGGYRMPFCMAGTFDWSLIGATALVLKDSDGKDDPGVMHCGMFYRKREFAEQTTGKKMGANVKYSRGSRPTDMLHLVESPDNGKGYVTLIQFQGKGRAIPEFEKPKPTENPKP